MNIDALKSDLERDEGRVPYAYQDSEGYWTCGVGFLIDRAKGGRIPDEVIDFWLDFNLKLLDKRLVTIFPWWITTDEVRQGVIANMAYQLGINGLLEFKLMLAAMRDRDYDRAADEIANSEVARQQPKRYQRHITSMRTGQ